MMKIAMVVVVVVLALCAIAACEAIASENNKKVESIEVDLWETPTPRPTAVAVDYFTATGFVCSGTFQYGETQGWDLPDNMQEMCQSAFLEYLETFGYWPSTVGFPSQSHVLVNNLARELGIANDYRGSRFVVCMKGFIHAQREQYNWPE